MNKKEKKKKNNRRNREIRLFTALFLCLFAVLFTYLAHYVTANREALFNHSYNSRQRVLAQENIRGSIYASSGEVLAYTVIGQDQEQKREYPYAELFAHVVGYSDKGKTGIEALENYTLSNADLSEKKKLDNELAGVRNPANNVYTTLDVKLQETASDALGAFRGAIVVTEIKTGRILAMVSKPDFDPNQIAAIWEDVREDTQEAPLLNRATQGLYPPGSTFKIVTALSYLRQNPDTWQEYEYQCTGAYQNGKNRIECYHGTVHGRVDFTDSFAKSCNSSFANMGMQIDREIFAETLRDLLFHQPLPLPIAYSQTDVSLSRDSTDGEVMQIAIGQGKTQITPIQLNLITAAIANDGLLMTPILVDRVENAEGRTLQEKESTPYRRLLSQKEASVLRGLMEAVVREGTGRKLNGLSYTAAGKTGSAQFNQVREDSHAWFTGYAPAEDPQIAVTVLVEQVGSGGDYAVPLAKRVFDAWFS